MNAERWASFLGDQSDYLGARTVAHGRLSLQCASTGRKTAPKPRQSDECRIIFLRRVEAMAGPTPQTHFEAWGQALIRITNSSAKVYQARKGLLALIMIADTNQEWAAWYYFTSKYELDIQLMGNYVPEVLAEKPKLPSHFTTLKAMTVGEL